MATQNELTQRLLTRFKDVPNVDATDVSEWVELAMNEHGLQASDNVPTDVIPLIMMYAEADGASQVALRTAYFFSFTDRDETVDKSKVSEQYRKLSEELWKRYRRKKDEGVGGFGGSQFRIIPRVDRR